MIEWKLSGLCLFAFFTLIISVVEDSSGYVRIIFHGEPFKEFMLVGTSADFKTLVSSITKTVVPIFQKQGFTLSKESTVVRFEPTEDGHVAVYKFQTKKIGLDKKNLIVIQLREAYKDTTTVYWQRQEGHTSCPRVVTRTLIGDTITWPEVLLNMPVKVVCPNRGSGFKKYAERTCIPISCKDTEKARWGKVQDFRCAEKLPDIAFRSLMDAIPSKITQANLNQTHKQLQLLMSRYFKKRSKIEIVDALEFAERLQALTKLSHVQSMTQLDGLLKMTNDLIVLTKNSNFDKKDTGKISKSILKSVNRFVSTVKLEHGKFDFLSPTLGVSIQTLTAKKAISKIKAYTKIVDKSISVITGVDNGFGENTADADSEVLISTKKIVDSLSPVERAKINRLVIIAYDDPLMFSTEKNKMNGGESNSTITKWVIATNRVFSIELPGVNFKLNGSQELVRMTFNHKSQMINEFVVCGFWSSCDNCETRWRRIGCRVIQTKHNTTTCSCNHLTSFSILINVSPLTNPVVNREDQFILDLLGFVGCTISSISLAMTITTFLAISAIRMDKRTKLLLNYCTALLLFNLLFLVGRLDYVYLDNSACKIFAICLHYLLLTSLMWMGLQGLFLYLYLVVIFHRPIRRIVCKFWLVAWGVPLIIVFITVVTPLGEDSNYGNIGKGQCWIRLPAFYFSMVFPTATIMIFNLCTFVKVAFVLRTQFNTKSSSQRREAKFQFKGALGVTILLGLTWIFGFATFSNMSSSATLMFNYLFVICNSLQGFFIFLFYCVLKNDVRSFYSQVFWHVASSTIDFASKKSVYASTANADESRSKEKGQTEQTEQTEEDEEDEEPGLERYSPNFNQSPP